MITVETEGVEAILHFLEKIERSDIKQEDLETLMEKNAYFVDFYASWQKVTRSKIAKLFVNLGKEQDHYLLEARRQGFLKAYSRKEELKRKLATIKHMDLETVERKVLRYLPEGTTIETTIHLTIDGFNAGFQHKGDVGMSLLLGGSLLVLDVDLLKEVLPHELHHVAVNTIFSENEEFQKAITKENCRSVLFKFIKSLLSEGMANYYFTLSERSFSTTLAVIHGFFSSIVDAIKHFFQKPSSSALYWGLATFGMTTFGMIRYKMKEKQLFQGLEKRLCFCLRGTSYAECVERFKEYTISEQGFFPPIQYLGTRMIDVMESIFSTPQVIQCIKNPASFLPLYQRAAKQAHGYPFSEGLLHKLKGRGVFNDLDLFELSGE